MTQREGDESWSTEAQSSGEAGDEEDDEIVYLGKGHASTKWPIQVRWPILRDKNTDIEQLEPKYVQEKSEYVQKNFAFFFKNKILIYMITVLTNYLIFLHGKHLYSTWCPFT